MEIRFEKCVNEKFAKDIQVRLIELSRELESLAPTGAVSFLCSEVEQKDLADGGLHVSAEPPVSLLQNYMLN